jgi:hypothetical protein
MAQLIDIKKDFDLGNKFLLDTAESLAKILDDEFRVVVKYDLQDYNFPKDGKKHILFSLSNETHQPPRYMEEDSVYLIFHNYSFLDNWGYPVAHPKFFPLPLGGFINDIESKIEEIKPTHEREYDFCFVGQISQYGTRDKFQKSLDTMIENTGDKYKHYVKYTSAFASGLDPQEYVDLLNNSKICLCPTGAFSEESFRFFEAIKLGAFPMVERLPKFWYYENAPMFFTKWQFLDTYLEECLNILNSEKISLLERNMANYNNTILDPVSLSQILKNIIDEKQEYTNQLQNPLQPA